MQVGLNEWFSKNRKILEVESFVTYSLNQG